MKHCKGCSHPTICNTHVCGAEEARANKAKAVEQRTPAWHDAPTEPGMWLNSISGRVNSVIAETLHVWQKTGARWYGPIPNDMAKAECLQEPPVSPGLKPDADDWIEWAGGECPVKSGTPVEVQLRCGGILFGRALEDASTAWDMWHVGKPGDPLPRPNQLDIVRFRIIKHDSTITKAEGGAA